MASHPGCSMTNKDGEKVQCFICLQLPTDPRVLPCTHIFCHSCLEKFYAQKGKSLTNSNQIWCPVCQRLFNVPHGGLQQSPADPGFKTDQVATHSDVPNEDLEDFGEEFQKLIRHNTTKAAQYLTKLSASVRQTLVSMSYNDGSTALSLSVQVGAENLLIYMITECDGDVNQMSIKTFKTKDRQLTLTMSLLAAAVVDGNPKITRLLLDHGADINQKNQDGWTALQLAGICGYLDIVRCLVGSGADVNGQKDNGVNTLMLVVSNKDIFSFIVSKGADINMCDHEGNTALHHAITDGFIESVRTLLRAEIDVNAQNKFGNTGLIDAVYTKQLDIVKELLSYDADLIIRDHIGKDALQLAKEFGNKQIIHLLNEQQTCMKQQSEKLHDHMVNNQDDAKEFLENMKSWKRTQVASMLLEETGHTGLSLAIEMGALDLIAYLLEHCKVDVDQVWLYGEDREIFSPLMASIIYEDGDAFDVLMDYHPNIDWENNQGVTALCLASGYQDLYTVSCLTTAGAQVNRQSQKGYIALHTACQNGFLGIVNHLVEVGADVNKADRDGWNALYMASQGGHLDVVECLIKAGADLNLADRNGWTALHVAVENGHSNVVDYLIQAGADVNLVDMIGVTPIHIASHFGHVNMSRSLIEAGADVNRVDKDDWTPLSITIQTGSMALVKQLVAAGADVNFRQKNGCSSLHTASQNGHLDIVKYLVDNKVGVNAALKDGNTPLQVSSFNGHLDIARYLTSSCANINQVDNCGCTALYRASQKGHLDIVHHLVSTGANVNTTNVNNATSLYIASKNGHLDVVKYLIHENADLNISHKNSLTSINVAGQNGHFALVKFLAEAAKKMAIS